MILLITAKIKAEKAKEEEYDKLIVDLCTTAIELSKTHPNVITINREEVGSKFNVTLKNFIVTYIRKRK